MNVIVDLDTAASNVITNSMNVFRGRAKTTAAVPILSMIITARVLLDLKVIFSQ